ncbi:MAG TPA: hypothetical protein VFX43_11460 [Chitinophagaceae bacterium]|jgi:hypothetical protein|nr:hypothetical protein [Chitinophagaceae bacterium]
MENSSNLFDDILKKLQESLREFNCKSEIKVSDKEAMLYGKFKQYMEKYNIVIHITQEGYTPVTAGSGKIKAKVEEYQRISMPNLNTQSFTAQRANCSQEQQLELKNKFMREAVEIGNEFLRKMNTP